MRIWRVSWLAAIGLFIMFLGVSQLGEMILRFQVSSSAIQVLRIPIAAYDPGAANVPFAKPLANNRTLCHSALARIDSLGKINEYGNSLSRLRRLVSLSCEDMETILGRFDNDLSAGNVPSVTDLVSIGTMLFQLGQPDRAYALWRQAPDLSIYFSEMGRIAAENLHDESRAFEFFQIADTIDPSYDPRKANMYRHQCIDTVNSGAGAESQNPCEKFDRAVGSSLSGVLLGRSYYDRGNYEEAVRALEKSVMRDIGSGDAYFWLAKALLAVGDQGAAIEAYRTGIASASLYPWNYLALAEIEIERGCYGSARNLLYRMSELDDASAKTAADRVLQGIDSTRDDGNACN